MSKVRRPDLPSPGAWCLFHRGPKAFLAGLLASGILPSIVLAQPSGKLLGRITSQHDGTVLPDVEISVSGTNLTVVSGAEGWYFLIGIPEGRHEVTASLIGYATVRDSIDMEPGGALTADFQLSPAPVDVEGLVVEGRRATLSAKGNRRVIGAEELTRTQASTVTELLQGLVAGVNLTSTSGNVGAESRIRIRGVRSLRENAPLFFVDDVRVGSSDFRGPPGTGGSVLAFLDNISPTDIDRIEILHASEATLLYGTDAAGGVILIFTKRGGLS